MLIEMLHKEIRMAIEDRLEGWELVDFLQISAEDIVEAFEDKILENLDDVKELIGLRGIDVDDDTQ